MTVRRGIPRAKLAYRRAGEGAEDELASKLEMCGGLLAGFERQFGYIHGRKFRADFAWPAQRLLVEVQGGIYSGKAHGSVQGILLDNERLNLATLEGWRLLRFVPDQIIKEDEIAETLDVIERALSPIEAKDGEK